MRLGCATARRTENSINLREGNKKEREREEKKERHFCPRSPSVPKGTLSRDSRRNDVFLIFCNQSVRVPIEPLQFTDDSVGREGGEKLPFLVSPCNNNNNAKSATFNAALIKQQRSDGVEKCERVVNPRLKEGKRSKTPRSAGREGRERQRVAVVLLSK